MQQSISQGQAQSRTRPAMVAGLGAALVASAVTLVILMNGGSPQVSASGEASAADAKQCQMMQRKLYVATTGSGGIVRLREGNYLSPPIKLGARPQAVVFPLPRPETTPVQEVLAIEGNSDNVVITSDVTSLRSVLNVNGVTAFSVTWRPMKTC